MVQWPWPPGTIVVCVDASPKAPAKSWPFNKPLVEGEYYTVRETCVAPDGVNCIRVNEIKGRLDSPFWERALAAFRFRPAESDHNETTIEEHSHA